MGVNYFKIFFENRGVKQTIFKNTIWLALGEGISRIFSILLLVYAARALGPQEFGVFGFAFAIVTMLAILSDFGISDIATRELARDRNIEQEYSGILFLKIILTTVALFLIGIISFFVSQDQYVRKVIWILAVYVLATNFLMTLYAFFRARQQMQYEAGIKVFLAVLLAAAGFFLISRHPSAEALSYAFLGTALVTVFLTLILFSRFIKSIKIVWAPKTWKKFLKFSWPLGLAMVFGVIYIRVDAVMMGLWGQITEVGWYDAAYRIIGPAIIVMTLISMGFYPALSRFFKESKDKLQELWNLQLEIMILLGAPLTFGGFVVAPGLVHFLYGASYAPAILAFQFLIFVAGLNFLYNPYGMALLISNQQKKHLWAISIAALTNVVLNLILIPRFSLYGAAIATVITYVLLLVLEVEFVRRFTSIVVVNSKLIRSFFVALILSSLMVLVIQRPPFSHWNVLFQVGIGTMVYVVGLLLCYRFRLVFQ